MQQELLTHELHEFLNQAAQRLPLDAQVAQLEKTVWEGTSCLTCANCCRTMSPTFTARDVKRIATHFRMAARTFKEKWLYQDKNGVLMNRAQPCQFLDLDTNHCTMYAIRPADCAGFPHLSKTPLAAYLHVHKQNLRHCPATQKLVEKLMQAVNEMENVRMDNGA